MTETSTAPTTAIGDSAPRDRSFASSRVARTMALTLQTAALILLLLNLATAIYQAPQYPLWWQVLALVAVGAPALATLAVGIWGHPRILRWLSGAQAVAYLVVLLTVPLALDGRHLPAGMGLPWPASLSVIAGAAAAVTWGFAGALAYGVLLQGTVFALVVVASGDPIPGLALSDAVFGVFYVTLFTVLAVALRAAGAAFDRTVSEAVDEARRAAGAEATRGARRRVASLIHDSVIVALLAYSRRSGGEQTAVAEAQRALTAIRTLDDVHPAQDRPPLEFVWSLQALTTDHDPEADFDFAVDSELPLPAEVAEAVAEATAEALRNSLRHAPPDVPVERAVHVAIDDARVEVVVLDDGEGFDVGAISPVRLGIRHGIVARLDAVEGASALVTSRIGYGTTVALRWRRS